jgi:hypothetical protein
MEQSLADCIVCPLIVLIPSIALCCLLSVLDVIVAIAVFLRWEPMAHALFPTTKQTDLFVCECSNMATNSSTLTKKTK